MIEWANEWNVGINDISGQNYNYVALTLASKSLGFVAVESLCVNLNEV